MTRTFLGLGVALAFLLSAALLSPAVADDKKDNKESDEKGWVELFNGKNLDGWKTHPKDKAKWVVKDGVLVGSGEKGHLFSERDDYVNFKYRVEAKINDHGNSGQYFRTAFGPSFPKGYEAQINSTHADVHKTGSLYLPLAGSSVVSVRKSPVPPGEWFTLEVIAERNQIVTKVNGKTTVAYTDDRKGPSSGHIALQQHNPQTIAEFRKIEIKELPAK